MNLTLGLSLFLLINILAPLDRCLFNISTANHKVILCTHQSASRTTQLTYHIPTSSQHFCSACPFARSCLVCFRCPPGSIYTLFSPSPSLPQGSPLTPVVEASSMVCLSQYSSFNPFHSPSFPPFYSFLSYSFTTSLSLS